MDEQQEQSLDDFFPIQETFSDFAGRQRQFRIELGAHPTGCFLRATEIRAPGSSGGYSFAAYSPNDPFFALGQLRDKIRRGLSTRYLSAENGGHSLSHDRLKGHIGYEGVVVDGEFLSFAEFCALLGAYEGFQFALTITDPFEDF